MNKTYLTIVLSVAAFLYCGAAVIDAENEDYLSGWTIRRPPPVQAYICGNQSCLTSGDCFGDCVCITPPGQGFGSCVGIR